ncbi:MAG: chlorite dismutase family protein [Polyangiaceae bacterium]
MVSRTPSAFTCFTPAEHTTASIPHGAKLTRYRVDAVHTLRGPELATPRSGGVLVRIEHAGQLVDPWAPFVGVTQHVVYTAAQERLELARISAPESGPLAVLIPICKSAAWWSLAQDERRAFLRTGTPGHFEIGLEYASTIYRRLYHARTLPGSTWDFLTYFEFPAERRHDFERLLARLRDANQNPEWQFVEREVELWLSKGAVTRPM